jgi:acetolactate synthase-1/2/3 large subunit/5-guanidino-2-oxopentanoate decarboxylase
MTDQTTRPLGVQITRMLRNRGVSVIFGIPGVHNQELYRGIYETGISHVLASHEQGAGFMADGYARASGKPGVAYVISGPGLTNIMTPMGQAYSDSVPLLVISSCLDETAATRGQLHQMKDQRAAAEAVCDWSEEARTPEAAYTLIDRALAEFETQRPRSKHIQIPISVLEADAPPFRRLEEDKVHDQSMYQIPPVDEILRRLKEARRPLFVFGGGCWHRRDELSPASGINSLMRMTGAAAFVTYAGRGLVSLDYPLNLGTNLARPGSAEIFAKADLVIVFGSELAEVDLWRRNPGHDCPLIRVDIDPEVLAQDDRTEVRLRADATEVIHTLVDTLVEEGAENNAPPKWDAAEIAEYRARWRAEVAAERPGIVPVVEALRDCMENNYVMVYSDMTQFAYVAKEVWDVKTPGHWHHPTGFGTLGYALPAAIGGAIARPRMTTMAIVGDSGFQYTFQELRVAADKRLRVIIILWDNGKLKEIEESMIRAQIAPNVVIAHNPDFMKLAEAYGIRAVAPKSLSEMQSEVTEAYFRDGPTLVYLTPDITLQPG